ncbi:hypothetical protein VI817_001902 [Penicillium citrinum]|nr:hypothetical protein VI817_001902 [Penicillium citrinum]
MPRWLPVAIVLGVPLAYYLSRGGKADQSSTKAVGAHHGANQEYVQGAEGNQNSGKGYNQSRDDSSRPYDEPRAMGSPGFQGSISSKQEGLSNADTMNPYVNEPGKSAKGEGETETAKVKGTVSTSRPQV